MNYVNRLKLECFKYAVQFRGLHCTGSGSGAESYLTQDSPKRFLSNAARLQPRPCVPTVKRTSMKLRKKKEKDVVESQAVQVPKEEDGKAELSKKARESLAKLKRDRTLIAGLEMNFNRNLLSYLELCILQGDHRLVMKTLSHYRSKKNSKPKSYAIKDLAIYNCVLHGFASKGDLLQVNEVLRIMKLDGFRPSPQTFAGIFECLGRSQSSTFKRHMRKTMESMKRHGYTLDDIFNNSVFQNDQREVILSAIQKIEPDYTPKMIPPVKAYNCDLLTLLNRGTSNRWTSPALEVLSYVDLQASAEEQLRNELNSTVTVKSIEHKSSGDEVKYFRETLEKWEAQWGLAVSRLLQINLNVLKSKTKSRSEPLSSNLYPFLRVLQPDDFVKIIHCEIRKLAEGSETYSPTVTQLYRELGEKVMSRYQVHQKKEVGILEKICTLYYRYLRWYVNDESDGNTNPREKWQDLIYETSVAGPDVDVKSKEWSNYVLCNIGRFLYEIILNDIKIDANVMKIGCKTELLVPAFYSIFRSQGPYIKQEIKPHPVLVKLFEAASRDELNFDTTLVPMVCPPLPWSSIHTGGYLLSVAKVMRLPSQALQQQRIMEQCPPEQLYPALDSLNQLGSIPWKINEPVLDILIKIFNNKGDDLLNVPPPPSECQQPPAIDETMTREETIAIYKQRASYKRRKAEMYSLWCDALYRLSLANHFRKRIFWLPHNMDFRGRVYPCPPHLSHLGSDTARSLLVFAKGEPLGKTGLDWLKIHLINLTGLKKRDSIKERLQYANKILELILDSAENPLTGKKWWMTSEEPWQTLSCCMEIRNAIKSGNPESFVSHFPIHQDGSCNGLQHYAALGRDENGARSVNLAPSDIPQDVYSDVAALVEKQRARDAENGHEIAIALEGFIKRKVIKQTVMTTVYGVTRFGARLQILKQLKDLPDFPSTLYWSASAYLTNATFASLKEMFTSTKEIQDWFTESARLISQICGRNVEWVTPLGLPVVQYYSKFHKSCYNSFSPLKLTERRVSDIYELPNVMKQKNAFPPNYIHSLDSTHMMLTSLHSERSGITFVSVHDCFWTHPKSVEIMNKICREQFVALHSQPILEDLSKFLVEKYCYHSKEFPEEEDPMSRLSRAQLYNLLSTIPPKGTFDLKNVLNSVYFFS